ncbi:MAG: ATP-binding protein [Brumimicrobium sp.]|nr:ATP-binding protein [Brumimicrobium sp.]
MDLVNFSATYFRSISKANKIPLSDITVLIGKNNEGKSNMLKALNVAMFILKHHGLDSKMSYRGYARRNDDLYYNWSRDFPIQLQHKEKNTQTIFRLEFSLNNEEVDEFKKEIKSNLNGTLPIEIKIGKTHEPTIKVVKRGKGTKTLNSKSKRIADYIAKRIIFNYIPAVRTEQEAMNVVYDMLSSELSSLEEKEEYQNALKTIKDLQTPILDRLSNNIKSSLSEFVLNVNSVDIEIQEHQRRFALRRQFDVMIDDGNKTSLEYKGDGVKSLAALGLLKNISMPKGAASIVAIEEPESHLHPGAIHILKETIYDLIGDNQVIVSTHNPLFTNRTNIKGNIIIDSGEAKVAKNIKEIRELIGVKASDNLTNARYALVVEGEEDQIALRALLPTLSEEIKDALKNNEMIIEKIGGAGNLSYKLSLLKNALCTSHVLLDNDDAGRNAFEKAEKSEGLKQKDTTFIICNGMQNSEFEDCLEPSSYANAILNEFGVDITEASFRSNKKWSERMKNCFQSQGKLWSEDVEKRVKHIVALEIKNNPHNSLNNHKRNSIDALVTALENDLKKIK